MELSSAKENFRRYLKRRGYSKHTIASYLLDISLFFRDTEKPISSVTKGDIDAFMDRCQLMDKKATTINRALISIKMFYQYLINIEDQTLTNPVCSHHRIKVPKTLPKVLKEQEIEMLQSLLKSVRNQALFNLMLRCGLRVSELVDVKISDIDLSEKSLFIRNGKGQKQRQVYLSDALCSLLKKCLEKRPGKLPHPYLFWNRKHPGKPISIKGVQKWIERLSKKAKISFSCHTLRHTFATQLLEKETDITSIQNLLGHEHIQTSMKYTRVSNTKVKKDYEKAMNEILKQ